MRGRVFEEKLRTDQFSPRWRVRPSELQASLSSVWIRSASFSFFQLLSSSLSFSLLREMQDSESSIQAFTKSLATHLKTTAFLTWVSKRRPLANRIVRIRHAQGFVASCATISIFSHVFTFRAIASRCCFLAGDVCNQREVFFLLFHIIFSRSSPFWHCL